MSETKRKKPMTLCWYCRNAIGNCPWSAKQKPVAGWEAEATKLKAPDKPVGYIDSFIVYKCPLYVPD